MKINQGWADPLATESESAGTFAQTADTIQKTAETRQQQERSDPDLQHIEMMLEGTQKTSPEKSSNPDPLPSAASVATEQQNQSRPSHIGEHVPNHSGCSLGPPYRSASQALSSISIGRCWCIYESVVVFAI